MSPTTPATGLWRELIAEASAPYRLAGSFAWHFARGKLGMDPVFRHMLEHGLIPARARVLDIGCGQGLLASLLRACGSLHARRRWPTAWADAPLATRVTGIELMARDVQRARVALGDAADFRCADMRHAEFPPTDAAVILDVLHYIRRDEQDSVLARVRSALPAGGVLLLRVGDAAATRGFRISQWVDAVVTWCRGHRHVPQFGRTLAQWTQQLHTLGFDVRTLPMSRGTPFANVLLIATVRVAL